VGEHLLELTLSALLLAVVLPDPARSWPFLAIRRNDFRRRLATAIEMFSWRRN